MKLSKNRLCLQWLGMCVINLSLISVVEPVHIYCTIYNKVLNRSSASIYRPKCWSKRLKILKVPDLTLINLSCSPAQCRIYHNTPINNLILLPVLSLFTISKIFLRYCDKFTQDCNRTDTLSSLKNTLLSLAIKAEIVG